MVIGLILTQNQSVPKILQRYPDPQRTIPNSQPSTQRNWFQEKRLARRRKHIPRTLDLWSFPDIFFYEPGYSIYTLRQASRRSWRIGQWANVNVKFFYYAVTMQEAYLRLMGKKLLATADCQLARLLQPGSSLPSWSWLAANSGRWD